MVSVTMGCSHSYFMLPRMTWSSASVIKFVLGFFPLYGISMACAKYPTLQELPVQGVKWLTELTAERIKNLAEFTMQCVVWSCQTRDWTPEVGYCLVWRQKIWLSCIILCTLVHFVNKHRHTWTVKLLEGSSQHWRTYNTTCRIPTIRGS